jgi:hypothetical protein
VLLLTVAVATLALAPAAPAKPASQQLRVGAASRSVLPLVDGSYDYLAPGFPARGDAFDPGIPVPQWDDGRIAVGNGDGESHWVHDDIRVSAMAVDDPRSPKILVFVASDLYMIFRGDADGIRRKVAAQLPADLAARVQVLVTASHNHHGPDTAFDVNHDWYEYMTDQAAAAVVEAVDSRTPANLRVAAGEHWFGIRDGTDPQVIDPRLNVLQAVTSDGTVIATAVQWNNHPETTLGWEPPAANVAPECPELGLAGANCRAEGRVFSADFPGVLREDLEARYGGEVLYFSGAVGVLTTPLGAQVWEVDAQHPLGNQLVAPAGATAPGGGADYTAQNFRRAAVIGEQLALASSLLIDRGKLVHNTKTTYEVEPFVTRLSNFGFRVLLVVDPDTGRTQLGHEVGTLLVCPDAPDNFDSCVSDNLASETDDDIGIDARVGDHLQSAVEYVHIGGIGMMFLPGEIASELTIGLPRDFRTAPERWYEEPPGTHAFGDDYQTPGYVTRRMHDKYEWTIGLGSDELGYIIPISNFRVSCVGDVFLGPGTCAFLHAYGLIEHPDAIAGATCKRITDDRATLDDYAEIVADVISASCRYGQAFGEADGHYEETNSASWDLAQATLDAVARITGDDDPTQVNRNFPGWWQGFLPS